VICGLCPRHCLIPPGGAGSCGVRINRQGRGELPFYGCVTALAEDPIEKKPLYHFRPGSTILSVGFAGCNLHCPFCQNWHISQTTETGGRFIPPEELIRRASSSIAYTYSEPLVHVEYLLECMKEARKAGLVNVLVTNGCIEAGPAEELLSLTDAANIDLKCFSAKTYREVLGGDLDRVLGFIRLAADMGVHVELTTLVVPGLNERREELDECAAFIAALTGKRADGSAGGAIPWHLSAYHPDWRWTAPPTPPELLLEAARRARKKLPYVYTGNLPGECNDSACPHCGAVLVRRRGFRTVCEKLASREGQGEKEYYCGGCGRTADFIL
jgi:pyruvate formate lyase activating enzyme